MLRACRAEEKTTGGPANPLHQRAGGRICFIVQRCEEVGRERGVPGKRRKSTICARLLRAYAAQVEALRRLRNGGSQIVRVEHVYVNEGGQAIIGNVRSGTAGQGSTAPPPPPPKPTTAPNVIPFMPASLLPCGQSWFKRINKSVMAITLYARSRWHEKVRRRVWLRSSQ